MQHCASIEQKHVKEHNSCNQSVQYIQLSNQVHHFAEAYHDHATAGISFELQTGARFYLLSVSVHDVLTAHKNRQRQGS